MRTSQKVLIGLSGLAGIGAMLVFSFLVDPIAETFQQQLKLLYNATIGLSVVVWVFTMGTALTVLFAAPDE